MADANSVTPGLATLEPTGWVPSGSQKYSGQPISTGATSQNTYRKRALAQAIQSRTGSRIDFLAQEVLAMPPAFVVNQVYNKGTVCAGVTTNAQNKGITFDNSQYVFLYYGTWANSFYSQATAEPIADPTQTFATIKAADGGLWQQMPKSTYLLTTRPSLMGSNGSPIVPIREALYEYQGAPTDAAGTALTRRYYYTSTNPSFTAAATILATESDPTTGILTTKWFDPVATPDGKRYGQARTFKTDATGTEILDTGLPDFDRLEQAQTQIRFTTKAKTVAISFNHPSNCPPAAIGATSAGFSLLIDGVAVDAGSLQFAPQTAAATAPGRFTFRFLDSRDREFLVTNVGVSGTTSIEAIWTSAEDDIHIPTFGTNMTPWVFGDSTVDGGGPTAGDDRGGTYGATVPHALGFYRSLQLGQGGTGFVHPTYAPPYAPNTVYKLNFIDRCYRNQKLLDVRQGARPAGFIMCDISGWDVDTTDVTGTALAGIGYSSAYRVQRYTAWLKDMAVWQPDAVFVFVEPRIQQNFIAGCAVTLQAAAANYTKGMALYNQNGKFLGTAFNSVAATKNLYMAPTVGTFSAGDTVKTVTGAVVGVVSYNTFTGGAYDANGMAISIPGGQDARMLQLETDWRQAIINAGLVDDQVMWVSLNRFKENIDNRTAHKNFNTGWADGSVVGQDFDGVHPTQPYNMLKGNYVATEIARQAAEAI